MPLEQCIAYANNAPGAYLTWSITPDYLWSNNSPGSYLTLNILPDGPGANGHENTQLKKYKKVIILHFNTPCMQ